MSWTVMSLSGMRWRFGEAGCPKRGMLPADGRESDEEVRAFAGLCGRVGGEPAEDSPPLIFVAGLPEPASVSGHPRYLRFFPDNAGENRTSLTRT